MLLTTRYAERIQLVLSCFDRVVLTGTLPLACNDAPGPAGRPRRTLHPVVEASRLKRPPRWHVPHRERPYHLAGQEHALERVAHLHVKVRTSTSPRCRTPSRLVPLRAGPYCGSHAPARAQERSSGVEASVVNALSADHPSEIGPYRIVGVLGEGGMGMVYRAEQTVPVRRDVALKILKLGMDTRQVLLRFEMERQALAVMDHPSIAKVFDGGATEAGRPYFVMELVQGVPVTQYCDEHRLGIRARVALFTRICRAVQHAHQKGVIHRDIKPSNVLVGEADGEPLPKIIDFGVARAIAETDSDASRVTRLDQMIGTPAYMSPEQIDGAGGDIDTRADIYALGVLLYELLTGVLPWDAGELQGVAMFTQALTADAPPPSARISQIGEQRDAIAQLRGTDAVSLRRLLQGDLDWIILRAMERDRERRYETPNGFVMDLERHLANEPVLARPPSTRYRMGRFVRRHRSGVAFAAVLVMLLAGFGVAQTMQAARIRQARDLAETRRGQAEGLIDFMLGDLRNKLTPLGRLDVLGDVGAQAAAYFAALPEDEFSEDELLSRSRALYQIGEVRLNEGNSEGAMVAFRESLRLADALSRRAPQDPDRLFGVGQSHFWVGFAAWRNNDLDAAEPHFQSYLRVAEQLAAQQPDNDDYRMELGYAHSNLGSLREARGDLTGAAHEFRLTLDVIGALVARNPANVDRLGDLAETHNTLAVVYRRSGDYTSALAEHERELEIKREILSQQPTHAHWRFRHAIGLLHASMVQLSMGDAAEAAEQRTIAMATLDSLVARDPSNVNWLRESAYAGRRLGYALALTGRRTEARRQLALSEARLLEAIRRDSPASTGGTRSLRTGRSVRAHCSSWTSRMPPSTKCDARANMLPHTARRHERSSAPRSNWT
jgi:eukaryotic-like serine/threonine-protein kinase